MKKLCIFSLLVILLISNTVLSYDNSTNQNEIDMKKYKDNLMLVTKMFFDSYTKNCKEGDGYACLNLAMMYEKGNIIVKKDVKKALEFGEKSCNLGYGKGCGFLGYKYFFGKNVKQDMKKALKYYDKACKLDDFLFCHKLGIFYEKGLSVNKDYFKAFDYYKKACDNNFYDSCVSLSDLYANGYGVRQDYSKAIEYSKKACDHKNAVGCYFTGYYYFIRSSKPKKEYIIKAKEYFGKACDLKFQEGCNTYRVVNELEMKLFKK
ncbi:sel1 repeat family protein [Deferribacter autotrophicus]|uniref:Sel1 repeat family protein n=1 Tax=Deferribacter autotrophicus TaxID=500465 RepID=A0A5A8F7I6_9BACT|nr:tetratricopeptide repeat protein [Deferribacter autotrophicus]KAA0259379.1 sel1 repeat family protein [Deferribacter autotrophicus]